MSEQLEAFRNRRRTVITTLDELKSHADRIGATTLAGRLQAELCDKLAADRFHLVVVGEFNHGKTSLVNALLADAVLPVGVTPTTAVIHHVRHASEPEAAAVHVDGTTRALPIDELDRFGLRVEQEVPPPRSPAESDDQRREISYPSDLLKERILQVDTPGVNDLCLQRADVTFKYIPLSVAVLFVIDAGQTL
mgnify:CR=1 FL=1